MSTAAHDMIPARPSAKVASLWAGTPEYVGTAVVLRTIYGLSNHRLRSYIFRNITSVPTYSGVPPGLPHVRLAVKASCPDHP